MRKVRVAQIGIGHDHAPLILRSVRSQKAVFDLAGIAFPEGEKSKFPHWAPFYEGVPELSVAEILSDRTIDAVIVETEEPHLTDYALEAARHGKHIHMDKPGGLQLQAFEELIHTAEEKNLVFHTGYMYRYNPYIQNVIKRVRDGELGTIISVEAQMSCLHKKEKREWLSQFPGGMMFFLGCHLVDLILQIQGLPDQIIPMNRCTGVDGVTSEDFGMALLVYDHGVSFVKTCACEHGGFSRRQLVITGSKGTIEIKPLETMTDPIWHYTNKTEYFQNDWFDAGVKSQSGLFDRYDSMMADFAAMVRGEKCNPWTYDYETAVFRSVLACCGTKQNES